MLIKCVLFLLLAKGFLTIDADASTKFFRPDYNYIADTESFYKIHTSPKTWKKATLKCAREGAQLFYPEDESEAEAVVSHWNLTQPSLKWIYIGVAAWNAEDVFDTIDGRSLQDVYNNWSYGEPNNADGEEGCVVLRNDGTLNDDNCYKHHPFICKKTLGDLQWNTQCDIPDLSYSYNEALRTCYKFHLTPKTWTEAYGTCRDEQSKLAIINTEREAQHLVNLTAAAPKDGVTGNFLRGAVYLGFKNSDGWITTEGVPLHLSGYQTWSHGQPDGGENEKCGSMFYDGTLNDIACHHKMFFICEHEIKLLNTFISARFGDPDDTPTNNTVL